jgi:hypothetical protein
LKNSNDPAENQIHDLLAYSIVPQPTTLPHVPSAGRVGNPKAVRQETMKKMKSGGTCAYGNGNILTMDWEDKRAVLMLSTYHNTSMVKSGHSQGWVGDNRKRF